MAASLFIWRIERQIECECVERSEIIKQADTYKNVYLFSKCF